MNLIGKIITYLETEYEYRSTITRDTVAISASALYSFQYNIDSLTLKDLINHAILEQISWDFISAYIHVIGKLRAFDFQR